MDVWVVGIDYGYEGKSAPLTWCESEEAANGIAKAMSEGGYSTAYVAKVPQFPEVRGPHEA